MTRTDRAGCMTVPALLMVWEQGSTQIPAERARTVLWYAVPEDERKSLDGWGIGARDARLLDVRAATFGERIQGTVNCPACDESLEMAFDVSDVRSPHGDAHQEIEITDGSPPYSIRFHLPSNADLVAAAQCPETDAARGKLIERCVIAVERAGESVPVAELSEDMIAKIGAAIAERDPQSEVWLNMNCPACGARFETAFDIGEFIWNEIAACARQLLVDVHTLALAYGWGEQEILDMSDVRRRTYLELLGQ